LFSIWLKSSFHFFHNILRFQFILMILWWGGIDVIKTLDLFLTIDFQTNHKTLSLNLTSNRNLMEWLRCPRPMLQRLGSNCCKWARVDISCKIDFSGLFNEICDYVRTSLIKCFFPYYTINEPPAPNTWSYLEVFTPGRVVYSNALSNSIATQSLSHPMLPS